MQELNYVDMRPLIVFSIHPLTFYFEIKMNQAYFDPEVLNHELFRILFELISPS